MTIYDLLKAENAKTLALLRKLGDTSSGRPEERERLLRQARIQIESLMHVEEQVFYPLLAGDELARAEAASARMGSRENASLLSELVTLAGADERFQHTAARLHSQVRRHVLREEQRLFPMARRVVPSDRAQALAEEMHRLKRARAAALRALA